MKNLTQKPRSKQEPAAVAEYFSDGLPILDVGNAERVCAGIRSIREELLSLAATIRVVRREIAGLSFDRPTEELERVARGKARG